MTSAYKISFLVLLGLLIFLAVSSGVTKIMLMDQDVEFFGKYGFSNIVLMGFGALQVIGGTLLIPAKTRILGAILIAITFAISAVFLIIEGSWPFAIATLLTLLLLGSVVAKTRREARWAKEKDRTN